jgi:hypothetical protein
MNKKALISAIIFIVLLVGCTSDVSDGQKKYNTRLEDISVFLEPMETNYSHGKRLATLRDYGNVRIIVDLETGCQYLWNSQGGWQLIVDANGDPYLVNGRRDKG